MARFSWLSVAWRTLSYIRRCLFSRLTLALLIAGALVIGANVAPPMPDLPEPRDVGTILGTLLTAQGAIAALTLAVTLFMMQGIRGRSEVDDRVYREYVQRTWMQEIFGGGLLAVGVTAALLLREGFISGDGVPPDTRPDLRYFVLAAGLAFFLNLLLAGVLFWRAISYSRPAQWMALRRHVNEADVRAAVQAFLGRERRARKARKAAESDLSTLFPDQGEGSADEAIRALLDDARRAMSERRHAELTQSLDSVMELVKYAMGEIRAAGIRWRAPGSQPEWPPLRELSNNLYAFREDVIRASDRGYTLELLRFDYMLTIEGMRERCGELFTVGLSGYRWNYQIANRIGGGEFREMLRDRFSLNAAGFMIGTDLVEVFPYAREMVRQQEGLLSDAMHSGLDYDYVKLHQEFEARLHAMRLQWNIGNWPPSESSSLYLRLEQEYRIALMGLGGRALLLARSGRVADANPYLDVGRQAYAQLGPMGNDLALALSYEDSPGFSLWEQWEMEGATSHQPTSVLVERYPLLFFALRLMELSSGAVPNLDLHGRAQRALDWFTNNSESVQTYVRAEPEPTLEQRRELAAEALRSSVLRDEIAEDYEIIARDLSETRISALNSEIHAAAFSGNSVERLFEGAGASLYLSGDAADVLEEWGPRLILPKAYLTDTPEGATIGYGTFNGGDWGQALSHDVHRRFCELLEGAPETLSPIQTPGEFLRAVDQAIEELNGPERVVIVLAGNWFNLEVGLNTENPKGYEVAWTLPESDRVGEIGRYLGHPILSIPDYEGRCLFVVEVGGWGQFLRAQFEAGQDLRIDISLISIDRAHKLLTINPGHFPSEPDEESKLRKLQAHVEIVIGARTGFRVTDPSRARRVVPINQGDANE